MEFRIEPSGDRTHITLTVVGDFTAKDMMTCIIESHTLGQQLGIHNYLVDSTRARNIDSAVGNYNFAYSDMKKTEGIDPLARVAVVASPGDHSHDFVETVSANAGMVMKVFNDFGEAKTFLLEKSSR